MIDPKELAASAITGTIAPAVSQNSAIGEKFYELGKALEVALDERDAAWAEADTDGDRINDLENGLRDELEALQLWKLADVPDDVLEGINISIDKIERLLA